jgi:hypothetical protein
VLTNAQFRGRTIRLLSDAERVVNSGGSAGAGTEMRGIENFQPSPKLLENNLHDFGDALLQPGRGQPVCATQRRHSPQTIASTGSGPAGTATAITRGMCREYNSHGQHKHSGACFFGALRHCCRKPRMQLT